MENNGNKGKKINKEKRKQTVNKSKNVQKVNKKRKIDIKKLLKKPCRFIGILGLSLALPTFGAYSGYKDVSDKQKIEKNAESEKIRSFRNLKEEDMGKYVKDTINRLYKDYPDLDYMIYLKDERTTTLTISQLNPFIVRGSNLLGASSNKEAHKESPK